MDVIPIELIIILIALLALFYFFGDFGQEGGIDATLKDDKGRFPGEEPKDRSDRWK